MQAARSNDHYPEIVAESGDHITQALRERIRDAVSRIAEVKPSGPRGRTSQKFEIRMKSGESIMVTRSSGPLSHKKPTRPARRKKKLCEE